MGVCLASHALSHVVSAYNALDLWHLAENRNDDGGGLQQRHGRRVLVVVQHHVERPRHVFSFDLHVEGEIYELGLAFVLVGRHAEQRACLVARTRRKIRVFDADGIAIASYFFSTLSRIARFGDVGIRDRNG